MISRNKNKLIIVILLLFSLLFIPFILWQLSAGKKLNVVILDKTVPILNYREHQGLMWVLNYFKIRKNDTGKSFRSEKDYYGFFPGDGKYSIRDLPQEEQNPDLIYFADTYGVFEDDYLKVNTTGSRSSMIYGGLTEKDLFYLYRNLKNGNTLVAEFNTLASPTGEKPRQEMEKILGIKTQGWMGRFFENLSSDGEVPKWLVENYEKQYGEKWVFSGPGFAFVSEEDQVVVLRKNIDTGPRDITFSFSKSYSEKVGVDRPVPFDYWFEFVRPESDTEVLANYELDLTDSGKRKLEQFGLSGQFPAVLKVTYPEYQAYYFAGDFADSTYIPIFWRFKGLDIFKKYTAAKIPGQNTAFFWKGYVPLMKKILHDIKPQSGEIKAPAPSVWKDNRVNLMSRIKGQKMEIYQNGVWKKFFMKGVNMGIALPGRWFTEFPKDLGTYLKWFQGIGNMNANCIRIYTLLDPIFYEALLLYNEQHSEHPLYLLQEIWPEENPEGHDYLQDDYVESYRREIENVINAVHGQAKIGERKGRAFGTYRADVSPYVIGYLVGRELEPEEVISTNENNKSYHFQGSYVNCPDGSATEKWLAWACDYAVQYEESQYQWQHPVAVVSWPTLDSLSHDSEWNEYGDKSREYNDKVSIDLENFHLGEKMEAGLFGAYHIYPNYPDFMNNEDSYNRYYDDQGRLRYGGYLKEFLSTQKKFPVLVAEFGLATGMGNAHSNPDGYHHGGLSEEEQGQGVVRMMNAIQREGCMGGIIFEWMDEWAKKTWITEPFMIPYERKVLWHNAIDPEQNYGILAIEPVPPLKPSYTVKSTGIIQKMDMSMDGTFLYIDIFLCFGKDLEDKTLLLGLDTYDRRRGEFNLGENIPVKVLSGVEFLVKINKKNGGEIRVIPSYNISQYKFSSQASSVGIFEKIDPVINKQRITKEGRIIPEIRQQGSVLKYGSLNNNVNHWYIEENAIHLRLPWGRLNVTDPSQGMVLDDSKDYVNYPARDVFQIRKTEGIIVYGLLLDRDNQILDHFPGQSKFTKAPPYVWDTWDLPAYRERLKKSYFIIQEYFQTLN